MKILFIGDYSNLHTTLAREMRRMGHQAHVLSDGCGHMNLLPDFYLKRDKGLIGSMKYLYNLFELLPKLQGYDVVQLINTNFLSLKPSKIKYFFDILKKQNKSVFLTLAGNDYYFCKACYDAKIFRFSEFKVGDQFTPAHQANPNLLYGWMSNVNKKWSEYLLNNIDGAMAVAPEYEMPVKQILNEKVTFTSLPIDFDELPGHTTNFTDDKVNILLGIRSRSAEMKGSKTLLKIAKEIEKEMPQKVKLDIAEDLSFKDFLDKLSHSDIVLDQLYSYSPGMTAIYAMALGKVAATGGQPEYYEYLNEPSIRPIFPLSPLDTDIKDRLIKLINDREKILKMGSEAAEFVKKYNDSRSVALKFLEHWSKCTQ